MRLNSVLIGLDLTEMDDSLIRYASLICNSYNVESANFIHVAKDLELPEEVIKEYGDVLTTVEEGIKHDINKKIKENFNCTCEVDVAVREGNAEDKILRYAKIKNADLILLGRKQKLRGTGVVTQSIARKSPCNLLLVSEMLEKKDVYKILVPIDFSKHSHLAMMHALEVAKKHQAMISCVNIYDVPTGYSKIGKSFKEFAEIMLGHAKKNFERFISRYKQPVECNFILSKDHEHSEELISYIKATKPDMVFIGSKGHTNASVVLLGSMAEKLIKNIYEVPLFIVKRKGESVGVFQSLLKL
ncbi:MAG: universal stress protein [Candidatus Cyclobacteriaceae bacterium M2_1C_046]